MCAIWYAADNKIADTGTLRPTAYVGCWVDNYVVIFRLLLSSNLTIFHLRNTKRRSTKPSDTSSKLQVHLSSPKTSQSSKGRHFDSTTSRERMSLLGSPGKSSIVSSHSHRINGFCAFYRATIYYYGTKLIYTVGQKSGATNSCP